MISQAILLLKKRIQTKVKKKRKKFSLYKLGLLFRAKQLNTQPFKSKLFAAKNVDKIPTRELAS